MNSVAAIGGPALLEAVTAFRALDPSDVWVLGLQTPRDLNDEHLRSLELLLEPFMEAYFAAEAIKQVELLSAQLTVLLLPNNGADPNRAVNAVSATMREQVAAALALVTMLDRAHAIQPVELVLDDDSTVLARTAVAWARARGVPSVTLPARVPLGRPRRPAADRTIILGERSRQAYKALGIDRSLLVEVASARYAHEAQDERRASARSVAKAASKRLMGWQETDIVVVFEPDASVRDSALQRPAGYAVSLASMFGAFVAARTDVPTLRLAISAARWPNGDVLVSQAAANVGLTPGEFAYSEVELDVWMAAADIAVSVDSRRAFDGAIAGVPAINLWRVADWYLGPAFAAEDGILSVSPQALAATLTVLAGDSELRTQIAGIAGDRISHEQTRLESALAVGHELVKSRRRAPTARSLKPDVVIFAPPYASDSAGIRALYRLCHFINLLGGNASIYPGTNVHPTWNTPRRDTAITDHSILVYPEIYFRTLEAKRIVRWCLNKPGIIGGPASFDTNEMVFYYHKVYRAAAQAATKEALTAERELNIAIVDPAIFYNDRSQPRLYDCAYIYKGKAIYDRVQPREIRDAYIIRQGWPKDQLETATLLRGCRRLFSFDASSALVMEAMICGAQVSIVGDDGELSAPLYSSEAYERLYYDMSHVERFLRLLQERWG